VRRVYFGGGKRGPSTLAPHSVPGHSGTLAGRPPTCAASVRQPHSSNCSTWRRHDPQTNPVRHTGSTPRDRRNGPVLNPSGGNSVWVQIPPRARRPAGSEEGAEHPTKVRSAPTRRLRKDSAGDMIAHLMRPSTSGSRHARSSSARRLRQSATEGAPRQ